ncbi:hypothetical protein C0W92_07435 [Photobacterium angustum]|uniref:Uncharacterized protein n=2 Tax=Vibrionaceae TaxID=641 RepID=A0A855SHF1_PHOAN|nr:hypothetical protein UB36_06340 [Photobacterium damselae subsp. damselae]KJG34352.1 hypothetical protein UA69_00735 [Photobacterium angustum]PSV27348.1 hypothetical protein C9J42_06825 [Photobacterium sp. GB-56]PSV32908.1 hypothetical protein C9J40_00140 [Photobacterium sp. GB-72]PSV34242.1 hypothetical protein C9J44_16085 [Photobacterium sp. GB-27]PSV41129.1 hypothetical protein C9J38_03590 [Photobacterium sp. GB-210]PSV47768.1 hypothetical protein C9J46_00085 [Photobacterium sp. GB-36]P
MMNKKPDRKTAMLSIISQVKEQFPLYDESTFVCGPDNKCVGCPKKLLELVDTDLTYWESAISRGETPQFDEIRRFGKLCNNVRRALVRNNIISN